MLEKNTMMDESEDEELDNNNWNPGDATTEESRVSGPSHKDRPDGEQGAAANGQPSPDEDSCELGKCGFDARPGTGN